MKPFRIALCLLLALSAFAVEPVKWTPEAANLWYSKQPWYVGRRLHSRQRHQSD